MIIIVFHTKSQTLGKSKLKNFIVEYIIIDWKTFKLKVIHTERFHGVYFSLLGPCAIFSDRSNVLITAAYRRACCVHHYHVHQCMCFYAVGEMVSYKSANQQLEQICCGCHMGQNIHENLPQKPSCVCSLIIRRGAPSTVKSVEAKDTIFSDLHLPHT